MSKALSLTGVHQIPEYTAEIGTWTQRPEACDLVNSKTDAARAEIQAQSYAPLSHNHAANPQTISEQRRENLQRIKSTTGKHRVESVKYHILTVTNTVDPD